MTIKPKTGYAAGLHPGDENIPPPKRMGRPPKHIDEQQLRAIMRLKPSLEDTAAFFEVSTTTIEDFIKKNYRKTFFEFRNENAVHTRHALIRKAVQEALQEDTNTQMLQFCLKNLCGWKDRVESEISGKLEVASAPQVIFAVEDEKK
jgi:predicted DNA-binding protein YlxM (UPF0122 family)